MPPNHPLPDIDAFRCKQAPLYIPVVCLFVFFIHRKEENQIKTNIGNGFDLIEEISDLTYSENFVGVIREEVREL